MSHRAFLLGLLCIGETEISGVLEGDDVLRTAGAAAALGARVHRTAPGFWRVEGAGLGSVLEPPQTLDFGNAGTGSRLTMGVVAGHAIAARFDGDASLRKRPMRRILDPLARMGAKILEEAEGGRLPLVIAGTAEPSPLEYRTPVASAQIKSAVLFAGLNSPGVTTVVEASASRDHTEKMLRYFGAEIHVAPFEGAGRKITLIGRPRLTARPVVIPADPSSAAFAMGAAAIVPKSQITILDMMANPLRTGFWTTLTEMGADIAILEQREMGGETVVDLQVRAAPLRGVSVPAERAPSMIDEYPILAVVAAFAEGQTRMNGLGELRVKESDRLSAVLAGLRANGVECFIEGDDLVVIGAPGRIKGGAQVETHLDHRIAMAFLIMGLRTDNPVGVDDIAMIDTSYPDFCAQMAALGAGFS